MNKVKTNFQQKQFDGAPVMKWKKKYTGLKSAALEKVLGGSIQIGLNRTLDARMNTEIT